MRHAYLNKAVIAVMILVACLWILSQQSRAAESPRIIDGSRVTLLYHITVPGQDGYEVRDVSRSFRDSMRCCRPWNRWSPA
jgi:hypothetical protein